MELTERQKDIIMAGIAIIANQGYEKLTTKNLARGYRSSTLQTF